MPVRTQAIRIILAMGLAAAACSVAGCSSAVPSTAASTGVIPLPTTLPAQIGYSDAMRLFEYDKSRPFDIEERSTDKVEGAIVHLILYRDSTGKKVEANLAIPESGCPCGAVMYLHGAGGGDSDFLPEALDLARHGVASLLITQPELMAVPVTDAEGVTEVIFEMRELQRSLDLLASRPEVNPDRLGFVGFSFGAVRGVTFAGVAGGRLRIAITASTPSSYDVDYMAPFDPIVWAPHISPAAFYLQEGTQDPWFTKAEAESLIAAAKEPRRLVWYEAGHGLDASAQSDREAWLISALDGH